MKNKVHKLIVLLLVFTFITPVFVWAGGEFTCSWDGNRTPPCQYNSDSCTDGDVPGDCTGYTEATECTRTGKLCRENERAMTLNIDYPPIPTPYGYIDLDRLAQDGEIDINTLVVFLYSVSLWIAGLLAFIGLVFAGFTYIWAGASPSAKNKAKKRFVNVLWGLAIVLLAQVIISIINPNILKLDSRNLFGINADAPIYNSPKEQLEASSGFERDNLDLICQGFDDATVPYGDPLGCLWNSGVVQAEADEWCTWCENEDGGTCEVGHPQEPDNEDLRSCTFEPDGATDEPPADMPDGWLTYMQDICISPDEFDRPDGTTTNGAGCNAGNETSGANWVGCTATPGWADSDTCPENFISECDYSAWAESTTLETTTTSEGNEKITCTWVGS